MSSIILLVDDDAIMLQALSSMVTFRMREAAVHACHSAQEALERIAAVDYDAIVSDVKMPGMDGLQLMEQVLKLRPTTPTLLVTGHGDHDLAVKALDAGAYAFIQKPIDRDFFIAWLKRAIQLRQLTRTVEEQKQQLEGRVHQQDVELQEKNAELQENNRRLEAALKEAVTNERALRVTQQQLEETAETANCGLWDWEIETDALQWFGAHERLAGLLPGGFSGKLQAFTDALHPEDRRRVQQNLNNAMSDRHERYADEFRFVHPDGAVRWMSAVGRFYYDAAGRAVRMTGVVQDITERKQAEAALRDSEAVFRAMFSISSVGKFETDPITGRLLRVNRAFCAITGYSEEELLENSILDITHPGDRPRDREALRRIATREASDYHVETRYIRKDGATVWAHLTVNLICDAHGRPVRNTAVIQDITARKTAEEKLRRSDAQLRESAALLKTLMTKAPVGFAFFDHEMRYRLINETLAEMNGLSVEAHLGKTVQDIVPDLADAAMSVWRTVTETGQPVFNHEFAGETAKAPGIRRTWSESWYPIHAADGELLGVGALVIDTTDQRRAESELRENEERLRVLTTAMPQLVWSCSSMGECTFQGPQWETVTGQTVADSLGVGWLEMIHPDDRPRIANEWERAVANGTAYQTNIDCARDKARIAGFLPAPTSSGIRQERCSIGSGRAPISTTPSKRSRRCARAKRGCRRS